ncbi:MAG: T9SS type A sorting domain-containing protein, partial [Flavobacteriales bacterium]|nr:T9SS type A sorting domain-containing protein [Flavobacteriales bacterium]
TTQTSTLTAVNGCDSVITTALTVNPVYSLTENASICGGVPYTFPDGFTSTSATVHTSFLATAAGCDSIIVTTLTEDSAYTTGITALICPGSTYTFPDGSSSTIDTTQLSTVLSIGGCDSLITTVLTVGSVYNLNENVSLCSGGTYTFPDGVTSTTATTHASNLTTVDGCDSIITSVLTMDAPITVSESVNSCSGVTYVFPDGGISTVSLTHTSNLTTPEGCDSIITTILTVDAPVSNNVNAAMCSGDTYIFPDGSTSTTATVNASYFTDPNGCDSVVITSLSIANATGTSANASMCAGDTYVFPDGFTSNVATIHTSNLISSIGCDSIVTTNLTIATVDTSVQLLGNTLIAALADSYQWISCEGNLVIGGETFQTYEVMVNGDYKVALSVAGCLDTSACKPVIVLGVLENTIASELSVFPNPASESIVVDVGKIYKEVKIQLIDLRGKVLIEEIKYDKRILEMDLRQTAQGMYLLKVGVEENEAIIKLIKE